MRLVPVILAAFLVFFHCGQKTSTLPIVPGPIPAAFQGKYIEAASCRLGYEAELYVRGEIIACKSESTDVLLSACPVSDVRVDGDTMYVKCSRDPDLALLRELLGDDVWFDPMVPEIPVPASLTITKLSGTRVRAFCGVDGPEEFLSETVDQSYCEDEL